MAIRGDTQIKDEHEKEIKSERERENEKDDK